MHPHFSPQLFDFLADLRANNDREWFQANKGRYEQHVKEPLLRFIEDFEPYLHSISEHFVADARANGGSMFRIYRDVRFSKDKTPYKTQAAVHFRHDAGKSAHAPGFYLHLAPDEVFAGVGIWRPDSATVGRIRDRIVAEPGSWENAVGASEFVDEFDLAGDSLKRPPKGFDPEDSRWDWPTSSARTTSPRACSPRRRPPPPDSSTPSPRAAAKPRPTWSSSRERSACRTRWLVFFSALGVVWLG